MGRPKKYPDALIARGVRLALVSERPIAQIAADLGIASETLRRRVRQAEADQGLRPGQPTTSEREEIRQLLRENFELRRANEILKSARSSSPRKAVSGDDVPVHRCEEDRALDHADGPRA